MATLLAVVMIAAVMSASFAAAAVSTTHATDQQPTQITITSYPKQAKVGQAATVIGQLTTGGNGLGGKLIYFDQWDATDHKWYYYYNMTTDPDGSFNDTGAWKNPGTFTYRYEFWGDDQYAFSASQQLVITVTQ